MTNVNNLAETLAKSGLAASANEAMRMAENIVQTESRVSQTFDQGAAKIDKSLERKTYKQEVDELIEKTSPEKKDFHIMVNGYTKDEVKDVDDIIPKLPEKEPVKDIPVEDQQIEEPKDTPIVREPVKDPIVQSINQGPQLKPVAVQEEVKEPGMPLNMPPIAPQPVSPPGEPLIDINLPKEQVFVNTAVSDAVNNAKPVFTDKVDEDALLKDLMDEQAQEIYSNKPEEEPPVYNVVGVMPADIEQDQESTVRGALSTEEEPLVEEVDEPEEKDDFIIKEKKDFKNPIPKVDLMDHFNFG